MNYQIFEYPTYRWWLRLALASDPLHVSDDFAFRDGDWSRRADESRSIIVDSRMINKSNAELVPSGTVVVLWDGHLSIREMEDGVHDALLRNDVEFRVVGSHALEEVGAERARLLFSQERDNYPATKSRRHAFRSDSVRNGISLRARYQAITTKTVLQGAPLRHRGAQLVFMGQTGTETLAYVGMKVLNREIPKHSLDAVIASGEVEKSLLRLLSEVRELGTQADYMVALKSVCRLVALAELDSREGVWLHLAPARNINLYQSRLRPGLGYLDFGGIHGSEFVYPRVADLLSLKKLVCGGHPPGMWDSDLDDPAHLVSRARLHANEMASDLEGSRAL